MSAMAHRRGGFAASTLSALQAVVLVSGLAACVSSRGVPPAPGQAPSVSAVPSPHLGQPFAVIPGESLLTVLVYKAGPLAAFGHNHVVACRCMTGMVYVPRDAARASFDLQIPVNQLRVDDPAMRAAEQSKDFAPDVSQSAQQAVRHNMLTAEVLDAAQYPDIGLRAESLRQSPDGTPGDVIAQVLVQFRGQSYSLAVPSHYDIQGSRVIATGEFSLQQAAIGLIPFRTMGGALRVSNAVTVRFRVVAKRRR